MFLALVLLILLNLSVAQDLYSEFLAEQLKTLDYKNKAIVVGKGKKEMITFMNVDCPHCRKEWKELKPHLRKLKLYVFLVPFEKWPGNTEKTAYVLCSKDKVKTLDMVLSGKFDGKQLPKTSCELLQEHTKAAQQLGVKGVPYNIILPEYKVIEGYSHNLLKALGL
ncbi:DsbC family protein [Thermocrinis minervae]|uniref:Protein disulfide-isomerase/thiol:disulfide interchange protein DsbC n=1 Tax=Thermocrinis minervae TaxID=381751 RepID=A0A1M6QCQ4_9AQUI|nr:DsbC family protein [Thermocrinis minervae]SHK17945.1 protein disulfide-isomerase/thiol:disulfide interchange protein DsbC [Thermocrinis minervae]